MNDWFEWNGVRCTQYGIHVSEQPPMAISWKGKHWKNSGFC